MKNIDLYESFEEEDPKELLEDFVKEIWSEISKYMESIAGLDSDFVVLDEDTFAIEYWPSSMDRSVPSRISYIVDDLKTILEKEMGMGISWRFGPNGNCQRLIFVLDSPIETGSTQDKILKVKKALKFT
jgi:hypothetical protein